MPRIEIHRHITLLHLFKERNQPVCIVATHGRTADFDLGKAGFKMFRRDFKEVEKLLGSARPAFIVEIRFVPDFPVNNASVMTVCPALVHVADNMLTDDRPFLEILRRHDSVMLRPMLDLVAETVKHPGARARDIVKIHIRQREIVGLGGVRICIKVREYVYYVNRVLPAVVVADRGIVSSGIGYVSFLKIGQIGQILIRIFGVHRAVVDGVHRLYFADYFIGIYKKLHLIIP